MNGSKGFVDPTENAPGGDAFYTPADPLPEGHTGDSIYQRKLDNPAAALAHGRNWLVLYRSEDARDNPIAVSGPSRCRRNLPRQRGRGARPRPDDLGAHFATINHDLPALTAWLEDLLTP